MLDPFKPYLARRWEEGCHVAMGLRRETREQGYSGAQGARLASEAGEAEEAGAGDPRHLRTFDAK